MSTSVATAAPVLSPLDALLCQHRDRQIPIPLYVMDRLRGLDLWACTDPPAKAMHRCDKRLGCFVIIGHADHLAALDPTDWRLAVDREGDATRGIVIEDHTRGAKP